MNPKYVTEKDLLFDMKKGIFKVIAKQNKRHNAVKIHKKLFFCKVLKESKERFLKW